MANRVLRLVVDAVKHCNLRCTYCHPGLVWEKGHLPVEDIRAAVHAAADAGVLELVVSGGEPTLHPDFGNLPSALEGCSVPSRVLVTNATHIDDRRLGVLAACNLTRIAVSVDGPDAASHNSARGETFGKVWRGLERLRSIFDHVTVISVSHQGNILTLPELSRRLAVEGLATQHHICAPSYSGLARDNYDGLRLALDDYFWLQEAIERQWSDLLSQGLFVSFNSFWPATGFQPTGPFGRRITLQQLVEQVKGTLVHIRPDGELRLASISWGRETVGQLDLGSVLDGDPAGLLAAANLRNASGVTRQLPRPAEARHKFQVGHDHDTRSTDRLLAVRAAPEEVSDETLPAITLSDSHLLSAPVNAYTLELIERYNAGAADIIAVPVDGCLVLFDVTASHVVPLTSQECREHLTSWPVP